MTNTNTAMMKKGKSKDATSEAKSRKVLRTVHSLTKTHIREWVLQQLIDQE